ncbi:hypothetical protein ZEAMMB73_Zm00001d016448 [Zea mays]|uniref:Uncharacterized protein n=1 Tax=Zea mays TaxID=4577 RepID=A0A1D6H7Q4_MAIZE|nr:hypothetical protein ZEAMMB73_Zm00001d016448 [Zea mays]
MNLSILICMFFLLGSICHRHQKQRCQICMC